MALGTHRAGYQHVALFELNVHAVATLQNAVKRRLIGRPTLPIEQTDVKAVDWGNVASAAGREVDMLAGGAPCQPFSLGGVHRGKDDHRNLFPEVVRAQRALQPRAILLENVRGLARPGFRPYLEYILLQLALPGVARKENGEEWEAHKHRLLTALDRGKPGDRRGYDVWIAAVDCANYGVPQRRNRVFMVAFRSDLGVQWEWPTPTHSADALHHAQLVSGEYWRAHGVAPKLMALTAALRQANGEDRWRTVRDAIAHLPPPNGGKAHPNHVAVDGARTYAGHTGSSMDEPAKTLKAGVHGVPGGENMVRTDDGAVRYFSIHEAALLQTFPEEYVFHGSRTEAMRQIGNAAPVEMVRLLAERIGSILRTGSATAATAPKRVDLVEGRPLRVM